MCIRDRHNDHGFFVSAQSFEHIDNRLGLVLFHADVVQNDHIAVFHFGRQGGQHGQFLHLFVQRISVVTGFRAQSNAAVSPLGSSDGALSRVAGAFLSPGFAAAASDFGSGQGGLGALALVGQVIDHRSMHYHAVGFDSEYGILSLIHIFVGTQALGTDIADACNFHYRTNRAAGDNTSTAGSRFHQHAACAERTDYFVRNGRSFQGNVDQIFLGVLNSFADRVRNLGGLTQSKADSAVAVADDNQRGEFEDTAAFNRFRYAVKDVYKRQV